MLPRSPVKPCSLNLVPTFLLPESVNHGQYVSSETSSCDIGSSPRLQGGPYVKAQSPGVSSVRRRHSRRVTLMSTAVPVFDASH